jgi:RNA polymerase sigma factor (sigma-70 family)
LSASDSIPLTSPAQSASASDDTAEQRWFSHQVQPHGSALKAFVRNAYPSISGDTDDVVQETFLRIWKARAKYPILSAKAFLFRVAKNVAIDTLRHRRSSPIDAVPDLSRLPVADQNVGDGAGMACRQEEITLLVDALEALPPRIREIIVLRKFQNLSQRDVAERLGISELTVQEQVYRGIRRMEKFLVKRGVLRGWKP